jgi:hypothetical protein
MKRRGGSQGVRVVKRKLQVGGYPKMIADEERRSTRHPNACHKRGLDLVLMIALLRLQHFA